MASGEEAQAAIDKFDTFVSSNPLDSFLIECCLFNFKAF